MLVLLGGGFGASSLPCTLAHTHYFGKVKLDRANYKVGLST